MNQYESGACGRACEAAQEHYLNHFPPIHATTIMSQARPIHTVKRTVAYTDI